MRTTNDTVHPVPRPLSMDARVVTEVPLGHAGNPVSGPSGTCYFNAEGSMCRFPLALSFVGSRLRR